MAALVDSNVLLRLAQPRHPHYSIAMRALDRLRNEREALSITQQNIVEFWAVSTRPLSVNGLGLTTAQTITELNELRRLFRLLPEAPLHDAWQRIVAQYAIKGKSVHDARLVAAMTVHGIGQILTFNVQDFTRYTEIHVLDPVAIA